MKRIGFLLACLALAVLAHFAIDLRTDRAPQGLGRRALVPDVERATMLSVRGADGHETRLVRKAGDVWRMVLPYRAEVEECVVLRLLDSLAFTPVSDEMTDVELLRMGRTRTDFGLDHPRLAVTVAGPGDVVRTISFGCATPAGDGVYVAVSEANVVSVISSNAVAALDLDAAALRRRRLFADNMDDIVTFDVKYEKGRFIRLMRDGDAWKVSGPSENDVVASSARVREFLEAIIHLEAQTFVWPTGGTNETATLTDVQLVGYGLSSDALVAVTLKRANGTEETMGFGRNSESGCVYALTPGGAIVTVPSSARDLAMAVNTVADTRIFPVEAKAVSAVSIDDNGTRHLLSRCADGSWRLDAPVSAPADAASVANLIERILALRPLDRSTAEADCVRVSVGTNAEPVSVVRTALLAKTRLEDLRSREILRLEPKHVTRLVVTDHGAQSVSIVFDAERGVWSVEQADGAATADGAAASQLVERLHPLNAERIVRLKVAISELGLFGLDKPQRTLAVDQSVEGSVRRNILIGDVTDGGRYATLGSSDAVFVISSECATALLAPLVKTSEGL